MPRARVRLYHPGMREMLRSSGVAAVLTGKAEQSAAAARASAPVESGTYRDSIRVETDDTGGRARARVVADVDYAMTVEANTGNLLRSLDAAG